MACDPNELSSEAACFTCFPPKIKDAVQTLLLCQIRDSIGSGGGSTTVNQGTSPWVVSGDVSVINFPSTYPVTQSTSPWVVSGSVQAIQSGTWSVDVGNFPATQAVTGPLTDAQLRASSVPVHLSATPTTDPIDRAGRLLGVISGSVAVSNFPFSQVVTGPLTDLELRASDVPVSVSNFPASQNVVITDGTDDLPIGADTPLTGLLSASGDTPVLSVPSGSKVLLYHVSFVPTTGATVDQDIVIKIGSTSVCGWRTNKNGGGFSRSPKNGQGWWEGGDGDDVIISLSAADPIRYNIDYDIVPA